MNLLESSLVEVPMLSVISNYAEIALILSVIIQLVALIVIGKFQREAIALNCGVAAFSAGTYLSVHPILWLFFFGAAFALVFFMLPRFEYEKPNFGATEDEEVTDNEV